jgi:hypothetical protein
MELDFSINTARQDGRRLDRLGIADAAYIYGAAVDILGNNPQPADGPDEALTRAAAKMAMALTPDAQLTIYLAGPSGPAAPFGTGGPESVAQAVREYFTAYGYVGTQHPVSNVRIAFTGADAAVMTCDIPCYHWLADNRMLLAPVSYFDEVVRHEGVWKIAKRSIYAMRFWIADGYAPDPLDPSMARPS